jgi:hypothetical protein
MRLVLALAAVLLMPTAAQAAGPKVTWPQQRSFAPGETISVKVASKERVRAALVRESASGKVMRTVARRTLRTGTFRATAPSAGRYSLRVGPRERDITVASPTTPVSSPPLPPATEPQLPQCIHATADRAELRLSATSVAAGGTLPFEVVNTSSGCLHLGLPYGFERLSPAGTWVDAPTDYMFALPMVLLGPGQSFGKQAKVPAGFTPGTYRVVDHAFGAAGRIDLAAQFDVTP